VYSNNFGSNEAIPVNASEDELNLVQKIDNLSLGQGEEGALENLPPGDYYLKLHDSNKNIVNQSYTLTLEKDLSTGRFDPFEPNNFPEAAVNLLLNGSLGGAKLTKDDTDWYTIEVNEQGSVNLDVQKNSKGGLIIAVYDEEVLTKGQVETIPLKIIWGEKQRVQGSLKVVPGKYYLKLMGDNFNWGEQYSINVAWEAMTFDKFEINDTPEKAAPIFMNNVYKGDLSLADEVDCYRVELKEYQTVAIKVTPDKTSDIAVTILKATKLNIPSFDEVYYELIQLVDTGGNGELDAGIVKVMEEGTYIIQVKNKFNSKSKQDYSLVINNYNLQKDAWEDNNNLKKAKLISLNKTIKPTLLGPNDVDWYQLNIPAKKKLTIRLTTSKDIDGLIEVFNEKGHLLVARDDVMAGDEEILNLMANKGKYYLKISDVFGNGSLVPYTLQNQY
jgi:hypothetical protein